MSVRSQVRSTQEEVGSRVAGLFASHGRMVLAICRLGLREPAEAEDAAQQTFLNAYRSLLGGTDPRDPVAWLAMIARNECGRRRRAPRAVVVPLDGDEGALDGDPQQLLGRSEEIELLHQALAELPPSQRQAVVLRELYGLSYAEVAAVLGASGPAVESLIFKGRRRLQQRLRPARRATGVIFLPDGLRDALAAAIPGFSSGSGAAASGGVAAKLVALPLAAKAAAVVLAVGVGGGVVASSGAGDRRAGKRIEPAPRTAATTAASRSQARSPVSALPRVAASAGGVPAEPPSAAVPEPADLPEPVEASEPVEVPEPVEAPEPSEPVEAPEPIEVEAG